MLALKYLLMILGIALFGSSAALVAYDIYLSAQLRSLLARTGPNGGQSFGWPTARKQRVLSKAVIL